MSMIYAMIKNPISTFPNVEIALRRFLPYDDVGRSGALVESIAFNRRVVSSSPALAAT